MSTTQTERKSASVSTWFSSLRRQPKPKKLLVTTKKHMQKSCVDLSSIPSDVKSLPASVTNSPKVKSAFFRDNYFCLSPLKAKNVADKLKPELASSSAAAAEGCIESCSTPPPTSSSLKSRTYSTASSRSTTSSSSGNESCRSQTTTMTMTKTTITKVTKTTVINSSPSSRLNRIGTIFDDNGQLISNLDVYKNYANNFRSNIMKNDSAGSCCSGGSSSIGSGSHPNINNNNSCNQSNNNNHRNNQSTVRFADDCSAAAAAAVAATAHQPPPSIATLLSAATVACKTSFISIGDDDNDSGTSCKKTASIGSIPQRPFKSSSLDLDDDIEFIDTSSSLSDIGGSGGIESNFGSIENTSMYYNTLPKLPKSCATCKLQQQLQQQPHKQQSKSKSDWNISIRHKVELMLSITIDRTSS